MNKKTLFKKKYDQLSYQKRYELTYGIPYYMSFTNYYPPALGFKISKIDLKELHKEAMYSVKLNTKNSRKWKLIRKCHEYFFAADWRVIL